MAANRAFFQFWVASRRHVPSQLARPLGRRGYASLQERVGQSSDRPWQIAAVAVTIPGLLYLRRSGAAHPSPSGHSTHGEGQVKHAEPVKKESKPEPKMEPGEEPIKEAKEDTSEQKAETAVSENVSSSDSEAAPTASTASSSGKGETKERDESRESKSSDNKPPSQRVEPTQK